MQVHDCGDLWMVHKNWIEMVQVVMVPTSYQLLGDTVALLNFDL